MSSRRFDTDREEDRNRVVIAGIGLATALGATRGDTWASLCAGRSGARWLDRPDLEPGSAGFPLEAGPWSQHPEPAVGLLESLTAEALTDAGLDPTRLDGDRVGVLLGLSKGGLRSLHKTAQATQDGRTPDALDEAQLRMAWPWVGPASGASAVARRYGWSGPTLAPVAACATGLVAALQGADLIRRGVCDVVVAGAADASLDPLILGAFRRMRVLARVDGTPATDPAAPTRAVRPWSRDRSGFLVGEGGAVLVLERLTAARSRGIRPHAELAGGALGADAFHVTGLDPDPTGLARVLTRALRAGNTDPTEIAAVHVHGTATGPNDPLECRAIRLALGDRTADRVACTASKAQVGHLLGAAGAVELAVAALAVRAGFAPPTLNLDHPDPACNLDATPHQGRPLTIPAALKISMGFGGHLAAAVLRHLPG